MSGTASPPEVATAAKVRFLARPGAYAHAPPAVEVVETNMSWVFLAGDRVFKLKKPVRRSFLDFTTLEARARCVAEEIRLNRRLAPGVYRGAVALRADANGALSLEGEGRIVDWLVAMRRLPEARMLDRLLGRGAAARGDIVRLAETLIDFYRHLAPAALSPAAYVDRFAHEHEANAAALTGLGEAAAVLRRFGGVLHRARPLLEVRVRAGRVVEGHGDLRPDHVCLVEPPAIIDGLEFDRALRLVDPFDEIAFLGLECARLGAAWVFPLLRERLARGLGDEPPDALLAFYWQYRALVRARLALLHLAEPDPRTPERWRPLALRYLELAAEAELRTRRRSDP